jgi:hypothetical protein
MIRENIATQSRHALATHGLMQPANVDDWDQSDEQEGVVANSWGGPETATSFFPPSAGNAKPIDDATWQLMQGRSWRAELGGPGREQLSLLSIPHIDFCGRERLGEMIVAEPVAADVLSVFSELKRIGFPIASMRLIDRFDGDDFASMAANNTSAFNCRTVMGGSRLSEHAYGTAIDINPIQNPCVSGVHVLPDSGRRFAVPPNRRRSEPGLIVSEGPVVAAFARIGWKWGGEWSSLKDYHHFSQSGR